MYSWQLFIPISLSDLSVGVRFTDFQMHSPNRIIKSFLMFATNYSGSLSTTWRTQVHTHSCPQLIYL